MSLRDAMTPTTKLGLGMAALGRPAYINVGHSDDFGAGRTREAMRAQAHAVLDAAFAAGIRYVDAARSYGDAEVFVRTWLDARRLAPSSVVVGSKWGYVYEANWHLDAPVHERKDHSLTMLHRQIIESTSILGDHLALYQIHSATPDSSVLEDDAVLDELARLRDRGLPVGISASGPAQPDVIRRALAIERGGAPLFASIQATWNLLERSAEPVLREAHDAGRIVIVKEALANGRLAARGDAGTGPVVAVANEHGVTPDAIAIASALSQDFADVVLLGASTTSQLEENLRAREVTLHERDLSRLSELRVPAERYWSERARLPWN